MNATMKPSTARLFAMLPRVLVIRIDIVKGQVGGADALDGNGKPCGLDANYPGFAECLSRLITSGHVVHAADIQTGTPTKGRLERWFISMKPSDSPNASMKPSDSPNAS